VAQRQQLCDDRIQGAMKGDLRTRLLREEAGFTLAEMMVTTVIMIVVLSALYSIFDMSLRVFSVGNDKVEAVENARLGLEKMEREIRQAYPYDKTDDQNYLFPPGTFLPNSITFGNNLNDDYVVDPDTEEEITYSLSDECPTTLLRNGEPVVEVLQLAPEDPDEPPPCPDDVDPLTFEYLNEDGIATADEGAIRKVRIKLEVAVDRGLGERPLIQILTTDVALRNRGG
jgi:competence protein ComGC